jgi:Tol biopolymer transport system component
LTQNTANSAFSEVARISPNGKQIVYPVYPNSTDLASLWIMNSDGTGAVNLTPTLPTGMLNCYVASFSADSSKVVFACAGSTSYGLYTVHTDGTSLTTVLTQSTEIDSPAFSPNGQQILFVTYGTPGVAAKRDQSFTRLGRGRLRGHLQAQTGSSNQAIASVNIDGSNPTTIVTAPNAIWELEILNSNLYYMTEPSTVNFYQLFQANLDGTGSASISDGTADDELGICGGC